MNNLWRHRIFIFDFPDRERARREKIDACQKIELERICAKKRKMYICGKLFTRNGGKEYSDKISIKYVIFLD